jgi:hypothetical protein
MESSSSGSYKDYPPSSRVEGSKRRVKTSSDANGQGGGTTITPQNDQCRESLLYVKLEEVARCEYFVKQKKVPPVGSRLQVRKTLFDGRIAVETVNRSMVVGFLPTMFNYIRKCLAEGFSYGGGVVDSTLKPLPAVIVDLKSSK